MTHTYLFYEFDNEKFIDQMQGVLRNVFRKDPNSVVFVEVHPFFKPMFLVDQSIPRAKRKNIVIRSTLSVRENQIVIESFTKKDN